MNNPVAVPVEPSSSEVGKREGVTREIGSEQSIINAGMDHSSYAGTYGSPLVADYLGVRDLYKADPTGNVVEMVDSLTQHLYDVTEQPLVFAMEDAMKRMEEEMNIGEKDAGLYRLNKMHKLMGIQQRLSALDKAKQQALDDIDSMM